jgi:hypothetical protein
MTSSRVTFRVTGISRDRRSKAQLASARAINQERLDQALEREWRRRVKENVSRRLNRRVEAFLGAGK